LYGEKQKKPHGPLLDAWLQAETGMGWWVAGCKKKVSSRGKRTKKSFRDLWVEKRSFPGGELYGLGGKKMTRKRENCPWEQWFSSKKGGKMGGLTERGSEAPDAATQGQLIKEVSVPKRRKWGEQGRTVEKQSLYRRGRGEPQTDISPFNKDGGVGRGGRQWRDNIHREKK